MKPILNEQAMQDIIELQEMGHPLPIMAGICEAENGGYNACISDGGDEVIVFTKPVFKDRQKAMKHAQKKLAQVIGQMTEDARKLGYELELDGKSWGKAND